MTLKSLLMGAATVVLMAQTAGAETRLSLSEVLLDGNFMTENAKTFAEAVEKATDGEVVITVHPAGSLGFKGPD